ncbi:MAG: hypothetical protein PHU94_00115 [Bacilli bacterium]|nr:hypothetical protein [Bacilli bacterium]MDD4733892.1 hypothetical protein [Bacilli bacterium]
MDGGNQYLIPANSKKSLLIFGLFRTIDLIIFGVGIVLTILLLLILPTENVTIAIICIIPGLISSFLVLPVPNYHNMFQLIVIIYEFFTLRRSYMWKGWCYRDGDEFKEDSQTQKK